MDNCQNYKIKYWETIKSNFKKDGTRNTKLKEKIKKLVK